MTAPSISAKDLLENATVGVFGDASAEWPIWIGRMPEAPDNAIYIADTGGVSSEAKWLLDYPTITIIIRAQDYQAGYEKTKEIKDVLHSLPSQDLNGDRWVSCLIIGDINYVGMSDRDRPSFTLNFRLIIEPANVSIDNREVL
jgi:hypothetical protein